MAPGITSKAFGGNSLRKALPIMRSSVKIPQARESELRSRLSPMTKYSRALRVSVNWLSCDIDFMYGSFITKPSGCSLLIMVTVEPSSFASASSALYFMRFTRGIEEILITPFSYLEMLIGFVGSAITRAIMVAFLILAVGFVFGAVSLVNPFLFILYIAAIAAIFAMLGILTALWAENFEQLQVLNTFVITPLTYLGGIFYSITFLPDLARTITELNPFFYFTDAVRSSMIGVSEANSFVGAILIIGLVFSLGILVTYLFKKGWKIRS